MNTEDVQKPALIVMAGGLGSRFGGVKQLARVGKNQEAIPDFSINDGLAGGFGRVILIIRTDIEADVREHMEEQHPDLEITYVFQDHLGPPRDKPWGTLHAALSAEAEIKEPFALINADDYYGPQTFQIAADQLQSLEAGQAANIAFQLGNTVPPRGAVTRALLVTEDGNMTGIAETDGCERLESGVLMADGVAVPETTECSMNFWCFHPSVMPDFQAEWDAFFAVNADEPKAECFLPTVAGNLVEAGRLSVAVVSSPEQWIGITNPEDLELARTTLGQR